eukprot:2320982-Rhodomonas_salina.2
MGGRHLLDLNVLCSQYKRGDPGAAFWIKILYDPNVSPHPSPTFRNNILAAVPLQEGLYDEQEYFQLYEYAMRYA